MQEFCETVVRLESDTAWKAEQKRRAKRRARYDTISIDGFATDVKREVEPIWKTYDVDGKGELPFGSVRSVMLAADYTRLDVQKLRALSLDTHFDVSTVTRLDQHKPTAKEDAYMLSWKLFMRCLYVLACSR
jgi:hypothetical protein